jgi:hypothetical protein
LLDASGLPELNMRLVAAESIEEKLALIILLGDDRLIREINILGQPVAPGLAEA